MAPAYDLLVITDATGSMGTCELCEHRRSVEAYLSNASQIWNLYERLFQRF
jgi:hypothetical protein